MKIIRLLLTGCINPNSSDVLAVKCPEERLKQYVDAITWYLVHTKLEITFCENSGTDITKNFDSIARNRLEILTYKSDLIIPDRGKGYKEMEILTYAFNHSKYISHADLIIKGTGRLILLNINPVVHFLSTLNENFISSWMSIKYKTSDSRFFFCSSDYLKYFLSFKEKVSIHCNFEDNLALSIELRDRSKFNFIFPNLWYNIKGISGGYGVKYDSSRFKYYTVLCLKNQIYRIMFRLGYWPKRKKIY
jgi:hypothetical protein